MPEDFVIARHTEPGSTLPYLLRIPLGDGIILKAKETWTRTGKFYCHRVDEWPDDAEVIERLAVRSCVRRGAAIDLVLDRGRENGSQIVITNARGRQMIFWQTARTSKLAQEWTYRFLAAASVGLAEEMVGDLGVRALEAAPPLAPAPPTPADVRRWASGHDIVVSDRGRIPAAVMDQYLESRARARSETAVVRDQVPAGARARTGLALNGTMRDEVAQNRPQAGPWCLGGAGSRRNRLP